MGNYDTLSNRNIVIDTQLIYFKVIFPNLNYIEKPSIKTDSINGSINGSIKLSDIENKVIDLIVDNIEINRESITSELKVSLRTIDRTIKSLKEKNIIISKNKNKKGKWILNQDLLK